MPLTTVLHNNTVDPQLPFLFCPKRWTLHSLNSAIQKNMPLLQQLLKWNYCCSYGLYSHVIHGKKYKNLTVDNKKNIHGIPQISNPLKFKRLAFAERQEGLFLIEKGSLTVQHTCALFQILCLHNAAVIGLTHGLKTQRLQSRKIKAGTSVRPPFFYHFRSKHSSGDIFTHAPVIPGGKVSAALSRQTLKPTHDRSPLCVCSCARVRDLWHSRQYFLAMPTKFLLGVIRRTCRHRVPLQKQKHLNKKV